MATESLQKIWAFVTLQKMKSGAKLEHDMQRLTHCARRMEEIFQIDVLRYWVDPDYIAEFLSQEGCNFQQNIDGCRYRSKLGDSLGQLAEP